jgi:hypothetical protein
MGKRDLFWDGVPSDADGQIQWPEDPHQREDLVRAAFGAKVIGALEAVLEERLQVARGERPAPGSHDYERDAARRMVFAAMTELQKVEVARLVKSACFGTLYWILVKLEHFPLGDVDFVVEPYTVEGRPFPKLGIEQTELHHLYFEWVERFSDHGDT